MPASQRIAGPIAGKNSMFIAQSFLSHATASASGYTFNPSDALNATLTGSNKIFGDNGSNATVRSVTARTSGLYYFEFSWDAGGTSVWLTCGIMNSAVSITLPGTWYLGNTTDSVAFNKNADTVFNDIFVASSLGKTDGHLYAGAFNLTSKKAWFKNVTTASTWFGSATGDPAAGTNGLDFSSSGGSSWCAAASCIGAESALLTINLGGTAFTGTPPSGFSAWG